MNAAVLLLLLALPFLPASCAAPPRSFRLELASVDATEAAAANLTEHELLRLAIQRSRHRVASMARSGGVASASAARKAVVAETPVTPSGGEYLVKLGLGSPPYKFTAAIDTASDLIWTQCQPCGAGCYRQVDPMFNPRVSSTYAVLPCTSDTCDDLDEHHCGRGGGDDGEEDACRYTYTYSGNATTEGTLAVDKLVIGEDVFRGVAFGCSTSSTGGGPPPQASGVVGLGRGPLSLVSQLSVRRFMYCLPPPASRMPGKLVLGADANAAAHNATGRVAVQLRRDPRYPSYYYLNLDGLAVGDKTSSLTMSSTNTTPIATAPSPNATEVGDANKYGMIIDIASTITFLEASLYDELADDLEEEIRLPRGTGSSLGLDLCFILPDGVAFERVYVPPVALAFDGRWLRLGKERLFAEDRESGMMCLMVGRAEEGSVSILGNFQQQNMQVLYNLRRGRVTFVETTCDALR
uniref:Peptidase A1 domain-containing protein n=1 Tax=Leersia perrieri TaxID=77586 RepID=A0A0D9W5L2_9ORYZ